MSSAPDLDEFEDEFEDTRSFELIDALPSALWALGCAAGQFGMRLDGALPPDHFGSAPRTARLADVLDIAKGFGLSASALLQQTFVDLADIPRPALLRLSAGEYALLGSSRPREVEVLPFGATTPVAMTAVQLSREWNGELVLIHGPLRTNTAADGRFDLRWFIPLFKRHRHTLWQVLLMTVFLQLCSLIVPLFVQVVIDRVLTYYSHATLVVSMVGLAFAALFKVTLDYLRTHALEDLSRRLDIELGSYGLRRALQLPLDYFARAPTGQVIARIREVDTIRNFLTGSGVTALFDLMMSVMMLFVLLAYSVSLTLVTLASTLLHILIMMVNRPLFGKAAHARMEATAASDQILLEALAGVSTVKGASIEATVAERWDRSLVSRARAALRESLLLARSRSLHEYLGNLTSAVLLLLGANLVMQGQLTVGQLLAFHMMAALIGSPLARLSSLGQELQQIKASLARFSDVVNAPAETQPNTRRRSLAPLQGDIRFEAVCFRYGSESGDILQNVSLHVPSGQVLGIVGPTGSGKSTLAKLLPRFHTPQRGCVFIDGKDIASMPTRWLRRQIGIVPQETFLFRATIHANIALSMMHATREQVETAARLAGAHEFIERLPEGYDTLVEERGANFSGGERQRMAIARALMGNPRILIFDEATSAVDHETERLIQERMREIVRGRTVLIIAHRLAALRNCDRIIAIEHGRITEQGTHDELLGIERGFYRRLWLQRT